MEPSWVEVVVPNLLLPTPENPPESRFGNPKPLPNRSFVSRIPSVGDERRLAVGSAANIGNVSFDVFLQGFCDGESSNTGSAEALAVLEPMVSNRSEGFLQITTTDGAADCYGADRGSISMMFNHVEGRAAWDVIHHVASAAGWVVMPVGCGTLLTDAAQRGHLPDGVPDPILLVRSGADILAAITDSSNEP